MLIESVGQEVERLFGVVRENLLGIAPTIADELARSARGARDHETGRVFAHDLIRAKVDEVLNAPSEPSDVAEKAKGAR